MDFVLFLPMTAAEFIEVAIDRGQSLGAETLTHLERMVFLISEAEVYCAKDGIDSLIERYGAEGLDEISEAFATIGASELASALGRLARAAPNFPEDLLDQANTLVVDHVGWDYEAVHAAVAARLPL